MSVTHKTGYDLMIIALVAFRGKYDKDPAYVSMNPEFYANLVNELRPGESFSPIDRTICGVPVRFDGKLMSFLLEGKE